nr:uncharacterized protein LOC128699519 [Cherax quadricarinatus]
MVTQLYSYIPSYSLELKSIDKILKTLEASQLIFNIFVLFPASLYTYRGILVKLQDGEARKTRAPQSCCHGVCVWSPLKDLVDVRLELCSVCNGRHCHADSGVICKGRHGAVADILVYVGYEDEEQDGSEYCALWNRAFHRSCLGLYSVDDYSLCSVSEEIIDPSTDFSCYSFSTHFVRYYAMVILVEGFCKVCIYYIWREYFEELLNINEEREAVISCSGQGGIPSFRSEEEQDVCVGEVREALRRMKGCKAAGTDGIMTEMLKAG